MFSCVWLHFKKNFGKYFLMFGFVLENTIENTFSTCCSHFLTFSQLPNKHIMSFIPKITNKTHNVIFLVRSRSRSARSQSARSRSQSHRFRWSRSTRSRSWSTSIGAVPVTSEIAIVVRQCGSFHLARCVVGAVKLWERQCVCVREECMWERWGKGLKWK